MKVRLNSGIFKMTNRIDIPYAYSAQIYPELITDKNGNIIRPRVAKTLEEQTARVKDKAEVFTPSWICNAQNNLVDSAWFGRTNVFNKERNQSWVVNSKRIEFPIKKTWQDYVLVTAWRYLAARLHTLSAVTIQLRGSQSS